MEKISFVIPKLKSRNHYALFAENTPFKPKKETNKKAYKRKPRSSNKDDWAQ